jgi:putative transposase
MSGTSRTAVIVGEFLLKFAKDRKRWLYWLFEARKRFGLCVLNYMVTSNHIHLLVLDRGEGEIAQSMQLIAGRTAQDYNRRKHRLGAYWQDRYHATAVDTEGYLARCMVYIDLNMVRAGVVSHPDEWDACGYRELQNPPERYRVIDQAALMGLLNIREHGELKRVHAEWVEESLKAEFVQRDKHWSKSLAVGSEDFVNRIQSALGIRARHREVVQQGDGHMLREAQASYGRHFEVKMAVLRAENVVFLDEFV